MKAPPLPQPGASREEIIERACERLTNTTSSNIFHHLAVATPCGVRDGLPVSMMLVGKYSGEAIIHLAAYAFKPAND